MYVTENCVVALRKMRDFFAFFFPFLEYSVISKESGIRHMGSFVRKT